MAQHVASTPATKHMTNPLLWLRNALFGRRADTAPEQNPAPIAPESTPSVAVLEGTQRGWLRVLPAAELLTALHAHEALDTIWRQSRLSQEVWQRDLLPGIERMAELVQLMPASESHHHAHAGGLLAHTLEMTLTALTWRNGCLLPDGAPIEQIDRERDQWTYAVFFASLLHDIAKPMTDLCITWRATRMPQPLRWSPISGSLVQVTQGWDGAEYHVDFTPKSQRDYGAHSRLALALFPSVAPESARALLSRTPGALLALEKYLGGQDKASLLARTVIDADRRSVANALMRGSRARFDTAASVPLIELLMQALRDLLKSGALPLNRDGAAGWVYDGCMWLVAKRAADSARTWIHEHAPDESIPGEAKNDRLFDTWQEYGCIRTNPQSGQAIWYVCVHGTAPDGEGDGEATYCHDLSVLCFPLEKLYDDAGHYPEAMHGRIVVREKRKAKGEAAEDAQEATPPWEDAKQDAQENEPADVLDEDETAASVAAPTDKDTPDANGGKDERERGKPAKKQVRPEPDDIIGDGVLRAPSFNRPKPKPKKPKAEKKEGASTPENEPVPASELPKEATAQGEPGELLDTAKGDETISIGGVDGVFDGGFEAGDGAAEFLDDKDSATAAAIAYRAEQKAAKGQGGEVEETLEDEPVAASKARKDAPSAPQRARCDLPPPVVLMPELPALPMAEKRDEPSEAALAFIQWVQHGLAGHVIRYNEKGAPVHFVAEGMALVSPLIFKLYAEETGGGDPFVLQREVIRAGWHRVQKLGGGKGQSNILLYEVVGKDGRVKSRLSALVLADAARWVQPLPPTNPVLRLMEEAGQNGRE